jgi:hypothetical protein
MTVPEHSTSFLSSSFAAFSPKQLDIHHDVHVQ